MVRSVVSAMIGASIACIAPVPWLSTIYINNTEHFFTIRVIKIVKKDIAAFAPAAIANVLDTSLHDYLDRTIIYPEWLSKNIVVSFGITKDDTRDLIEVAGDNIKSNDENVDRNNNRYNIISVDVDTQNFDKSTAINASKWISDFIIKLTFRQRYLELLRSIRDENEAILVANGTGLPGIALALESVKAHLTKVNEIVQKNPELAKQSNATQFNLSASPPQGSLYKPNDQMSYLPVSMQNAGLEIQQSQLQSRWDQIQFQNEICQEIIAVANKAMDKVSNSTIEEIQLGLKTEPNLWRRSDKVLHSMENNSEVWKKNYVESAIREIETRQRLLEDHYTREISFTHGSILKPWIKLSVLLPILTLVGFILPGLWRIYPIIISKIKELQ